MRFLILNHNARERGTYFRAFPFAERFAARGHDVVFCCVQRERMYRTTRTRMDVSGGGSLVRYEMPNWSGRQDSQEGRGALDIARRLWLASTRRFDVVWGFSHKYDAVVPARVARWLHGATFISDWCDRWGGAEGLFESAVAPSEAFRRLPAATQRARLRAFAGEAAWEERSRREWADGVTVISRALEERTLGLGVPRERVLRLHSGANLDGVVPLDKVACRGEFDLPADALLLGYVANFHPDEAMLLDALEIVMRRSPDARFVHAGAPLAASQAELARRGLADRVRYLGWVAPEAFPKVLGACDLMLLPLSGLRLNVERWPHKVTDYLSAGRPVAACAVGDVADLVGDGIAGELGAPDADGLAGAVGRLLDRRDEWDAIGRRGREIAESRLNWDTQADRALEFIERVRASCTGKAP